MKEFALLFRQASFDRSKLSTEQFHEVTKKWQNWVGNIAAQGRLSNPGFKLTQEGNVLKPGGVITDGPFVEIRERLGSLIVIKAENLEEATTLAHGCPALEAEGSVEVRPLLEDR